MTSDTRSILDQLRTKKESLLKSHGPRNPLDAKITQLIGEYEAFDRKDEIGFAQSRLDLCDLQLAKGDVLSALKSLAQASAFHSEKAAKKAAEIMSRINTNKYTRAVKTFKTIDVKRTVLEIIKNTENGFHKNRLQTVFAMYTKDITKAVNFSAANIPENPKAGVPDFINLARTLSQRKNHMEALPKIGNVINTHFKDIIDYGGRPLIQELEERFRGNDDALAALALDKENSTPLHDFILGATFTELLSFINNSDAFLFADAMNEEDKDLLIDEFKSRVLGDLQSPHKTALVLLQKASCTHRFWQAPEWRHDFLSVLKTKLENAPDHHGYMALALIAYMNGSNGDANMHFRKCLEGESPFTTTGATSFIASVTNTRLSNKLLDYSSITISEYSFKERSIVTCSDEIYFKRYAIQYLESLRRTGSNCPVHFHIAGNKIRLKPFVSTIVDFGDVSFSYETPIERTPAYYASIRFLKAPFMDGPPLTGLHC